MCTVVLLVFLVPFPTLHRGVFTDLKQYCNAIKDNSCTWCYKANLGVTGYTLVIGGRLTCKIRLWCVMQAWHH